MFFENVIFMNQNKVIPNGLCRVKISPTESFLREGRNPTLVVQSAGHVLHVFTNGQLSGMKDKNE